MLKLDASKSGSFRIGGEIEVNRLGFGAMRLTGPGIWGPPADRAEAIRTLKRVPELGINFIDTADSYGPDVSEQLIREALYPYDGILIATKAGLRRPSPGQWEPDGRPEYLREQAIKSREKLGLEQIGLWQLHSIDPKVPRDEQFAAVKSLRDEGIIRHAGLSNVSVGTLKPLQRYSKWRPCRTATISSIAAVKTCWTIVSDTASASSLGSRSLQVASPSRARSSIQSPRPTTRLRARLLSLGFSSAARLCFPFRALRRSRIWRKMLPRSISSSRMESSLPWTAQDGRNGRPKVR